MQLLKFNNICAQKSLASNGTLADSISAKEAIISKENI